MSSTTAEHRHARLSAREPADKPDGQPPADMRDQDHGATGEHHPHRQDRHAQHPQSQHPQSPHPQSQHPDAPGPDAAQQAGEDMLREMYEHDRTVLFSYVLRLTRGDAQHAEDIVQETMLRAWQNARKLGARRAQLRPWLATVARNVFIDAHRRLSSRPQETDAEAIEYVPVADESDNVLASIAITNAMTGLSAAHREVLVELYYRGKTLQDTAATLGIPVGTVKSRAYHALRALKVILEERGVKPGF
jgi:RNA polymerase sigma-70 factor (ECF subfamily)